MWLIQGAVLASYWCLVLYGYRLMIKLTWKCFTEKLQYRMVIFLILDVMLLILIICCNGGSK